MIGSDKIKNGVLEMNSLGPNANWQGGGLTIKLTMETVSLLRAWSGASSRKIIFMDSSGKEVLSMYVTDANPGGYWHIDSKGSILMTREGKPFIPSTEMGA